MACSGVIGAREKKNEVEIDGEVDGGKGGGV